MKPIVEFVAETALPTHRGSYRVRAYRDPQSQTEPLAILWRDVDVDEAVPVRIHDECLTSEVLGSLKCDCREQLDFALQFIRGEAGGLVIYLRQEGRGIGLANKIAAYALQEEGFDTVDANRALGLPDDARRYHAAAAILEDLGIRSVRLLTNNPRKISSLQALGIEVVGRLPIVVDADPHAEGYLAAKAARMGHLMDGDADPQEHPPRSPVALACK